MTWTELAERAERRHREGEKRVSRDGDARGKQLVRIANTAYAAGLAWLMVANQSRAREWLVRAAEGYRASFEFAPPESWGRPIGAVKARLIADDLEGAELDARWSLHLGSAAAPSPIGRYAAVLAFLVLGEDDTAKQLAVSLRAEGADRFPRAVADTLVALGDRDDETYESGLGAVLASFEERGAYLEDVPVADTVIVLEALASRRRMAVRPSSLLLPAN